MITTGELAKRVGGRLEGDPSLPVTGLAGVRDARQGEVTFIAARKYAGALARTSATAALVPEDWSGPASCAIIRVKEVEKMVEQLAAMLAPPEVKPTPGIHPTAVIALNAKLGKDVSIGPWCVLEDGVKVGDRTSIGAGCYLGHGTILGADCRLYPHVSTREGTRIGDRAIIHNGVVIGSDGYGFVPEQKDGQVFIRKVPQTGIVEIGNDVEIGANTTIDRARFGRTRIGNSVKIDNLVHIAHNVVVGDYCGMAAQVGIAGSARLGSRVILWGQAGVVPHVEVGDGVTVGAKSGVTKDVEPNTFVSGFPAIPHDKDAKNHAEVMRLSLLRKRVAELEKRVGVEESR